MRRTTPPAVGGRHRGALRLGSGERAEGRRPETVDTEKRSGCERVQDTGAAGPRGWEGVGAEGMVLSRVSRWREKSGTLERA